MAVLAGAAAALAALAALYNAPSSTPLSPLNTGPLGGSVLAGLGYRPVLDHEGLECRPGLVVIAPYVGQEWLPSWAVDCASRGAVVVILDDGGLLGGGLTLLGVPLEVGNATVLDEVERLGSRFEPIANFTAWGRAFRVAMGEPRPVTGPAGGPLEALTSLWSYVDEDGDTYYSFGEPLGPATVASSVEVGQGVLAVVGDWDFAANRLAGLPGNRGLLQSLPGEDRVVLLDGLGAPAWERLRLAGGESGWLRLAVASLAGVALAAAAARRA